MKLSRQFLRVSIVCRLVAVAVVALAVSGCGGSSANITPSSSASSESQLVSALTADLNDYLAKRSAVEHISTASLSVNLPSTASTIDATAGSAQYGGQGGAVTPASLFQIGSNTKAFTAVVLLQLEAEGKLTIDQTVGDWLPQYPAWAHVTIRQLLNMTSGIPTYDDTPAWEQTYASNPTSDETGPQLVAYVYPAPLQSGWLYSNTNYQLAAMIIERATGDDYATEINRRIIAPLGLSNTFYYPGVAPSSIIARMVAGYFFSQDPGNAGLAPLYGRDVRPFSLSWAGPAGGVISTPHDLTGFIRALYQGPLLGSKQRDELMSLVSDRTGQPIATTTSDDPVGFGLGVGQITSPLVDGTVWYYEGETLGYRMTYAYFPQANVVFTVAVNSQPTSSDDDIRLLVNAVYLTLKAAGKM